MTDSTKGRLVWNHSTHLAGLIPVLKKLITQAGIYTVTPGVISRTKSHCPQLQLRISVPLQGGYKLIARQGKTVQEVFVITDLNQEDLELAISQSLKKNRQS